MSLIKTEYRIERWKDVYSGGIWSEQKVLVLGADDMTAECRAYNPILDINITGEMTLSFEMVSKYFDSSTGDYVDNYMLPWVFNESKIKLYCPQYGNDVNNGWFDFVVKERTDKRGKNLSYEFKCEYLPLNELRRTGQNLVFNTELSNNIGTLDELARKVLERTEWGLDTTIANLTEYVEEQVFKYQMKEGESFIATSVPDASGEIRPSILIFAELPDGSYPYFFIPYSEIGLDTDTIQIISFRYTEPIFQSGTNVFADAASQYTIPRKVPQQGWDSVLNPTFSDLEIINARGHKIPGGMYESIYDPYKERYAIRYEKDDDSTIYYGYKTTTAARTSVVFVGDGVDVSLQIETTGTPPTSFIQNSYVVKPNHGFNNNNIVRFEYVNFLLGTPALDTSYYVVNSTPDKFQISIAEGGAPINFTKAGIGRVRAYSGSGYVSKTIFLPDHGFITDDLVSFYFLTGVTDSTGKLQSATENSVRYFVHKLNDDNFQIKETIAGPIINIEGNGVGYIYKNNVDVSVDSIGDTIQLASHGYVNDEQIVLFQFSTGTGLIENTEYYIINKTKDTFQLSETLDGVAVAITASATAKLINISRIDSVVTAELEETTYYYYYDSNGTEIEHTGTGLKAIRKINNEKTRTLEAEETNVFNLLQKIAELFKVWVRFDVYHTVTGAIADKKITFVDRIGEDKHIGFTYGINVSSIERTIISNELATKMRVKQIVNDALPDGFCSIADAVNNPAKEEYLINLDYYATIGLINQQDLYKDLYDDGSGEGLAFFSELKRLNLLIQYYEIDYQDNETKVANIIERLAAAEGAVIEKQTLIDQLLFLYNNGAGSEAAREDYTNNYERLTEEQTKNESYVDLYTEQKNSLISRRESLTNIINGYMTQKKNLEDNFHTKYSRFLQEGTWTGDNYIDADAYYFDALNVLNESSRPMVEYKIDIVDLSVLEGYDYYNFQVGDLTYVEDAEFFGVQSGDLDAREQIYREPVIIAQITANLDNPKNNKIIVRNYNDQFDELFERITATVQSYEFNENKYNRTTERFTNDGAISFPALQKSLISNELILSQSVTESFKQDNTGIYLTNLQNPLEKVRIVSGGIFLSNDGGTKWSTGITGAGINADWIVAGSIDTSKITIYDGSTPKFVWDSNGITAYSTLVGETLNNYVRLNENGLIAKKENIKMFALDWNGLYLKTGAGIYDIQLGSHTIGTTDYLFSAIKNTDNSVIFSINEDGEAYFKGNIEANGTLTSISGGYTVVAGAKDDYLIRAYDSIEENIFSVSNDGAVTIGGTVTIGGNITLSGNITWSSSNSPTKAVYARTNIAKPVNGTLYTTFPATSSDNWHTSLDNINDNYVSYTYDAGTTWTTTLLLQGQNGNGIKFAYLQTSTSTTPTTPSGNGSSIPSGWTASPTGVDSTNKYEWVSQSSYNGITKIWSAWSTPAVWSKYAVDGAAGADGADGADGTNALATRDGIILALTQAQPEDGIYNYPLVEGGPSYIGINASAINAGIISGREIRVTGYGLEEGNSAYYIYNGIPNPSTNPPKGWLSYDVKGAGTSEEAANRVVLHAVDVLKIQSEQNMSIGCVRFNSTTQKYETSPTYTMYAFGNWNFYGATVTGLTARFS